MATRKNNFLNAKPVSKMGGQSGGVRKPSKPYSKPSSTSGKPKLQSKPQKPSAKPTPKSSATPPAANKPAPVQRRTRVNGRVKPGMVQRNQVGQPKVQRQGPTTSNVPPRATPLSTQKPDGPIAPKPKAAAKPNPYTSGKPNPNAGVRGVQGKGGSRLLSRVGKAGAITMALGAANAADDARLTPAQRAKKYEVVNPDRGQNLLSKLQRGTLGQPNKTVNRDPNGRSSQGVNTPRGRTVATGSQQYNDYRNKQIADNRERLRGVGNPPPKPPAPPRQNPPSPAADQRRSGGGNNTAPRSQTPPAPRFTGTVDEGRKMWAEKYSSSKYDGQAIQKEAKKLLDEIKRRKEDKSNAQRAGWDGNKNY